MTIGEATSLAVIAGGLAARGDVFRLDMGRPVRVVDAAQAVIRATRDGAGAPIEIVGSRPGEKLHEDLEAPGEPVSPTGHDHVVRCGPRYADPEWLESGLRRLRALVAEADERSARDELERLAAGVRVDGQAVETPVRI